MDRKFITVVGCILAAIMFLGGCAVAYIGMKIYDDTLAGRPKYECVMTYPQFYETLDWGGVEHTSEDAMHAYECYLEENLSAAGEEAKAAEKPFRNGTKAFFIIAVVFLLVVIVINVADEAAKYNKTARHGIYRQIKR